MNTHRLLLPLGVAAALFGFGALETASAYAVVVVRGRPWHHHHHHRHGPRVLVVNPPPVYAYRPVRVYPRWGNNVVIVRGGHRHHHHWGR